MFRGDTEHDEGYFVTGEISKNVKQGQAYQNHAILYRTNAQSRVIEEILIKSDIPYQIVGGSSSMTVRKLRTCWRISACCLILMMISV